MSKEDKLSRKARRVINKNGKEVFVPPTENNQCIKDITAMLEKWGVRYKIEYYFDKVGCKKFKYDLAIFSNETSELPCILLEYDGASHYDVGFWRDIDKRPERIPVELTKRQLSDLEKIKIAHEFGVPIIRINDEHRKVLYEFVVSLVSIFIDNIDLEHKEVTIMDMFEKYGWRWTYELQKKATQLEEERYNKMIEDGKKRGIRF